VEFSNLSSEFGRLASTPRAGLDPELAAIVGKMAANRVRAGVVVLEEVVDHVYQAVRPMVEGLTPRDVRDAISGYGQRKEMSRDELVRQIAELKRQAQLVSAVEDAQAGKLPKRTGLQRRKPSGTVLALQTELREVMRKSGVDQLTGTDETVASALDRVKTRLQRDVEALEQQIELGRRRPVKAGVVDDEAAAALRAKQQALRATLRDVSGETGLAEARRLALAEQHTAESIAALEARIGSGKLAADPAGETSPWSGSLGGLKAHQQALRDQVSGERATRRAVEILRDKVKKGDIAPAPKKGRISPLSPRFRALKAEQTALREELKELRKAARPPKDPEALRLRAFRSRIKRQEEELTARLAEVTAGRIPGPRPKPSPLRHTTMDIAAQGRVNLLREKIDGEIRALKLAQRSRLEKGIDWTVGWGRGIKLTSSATLSMLTSSAIQRTFLFNPIEEAIGAVLSRVPGPAGRLLRERAPVEGGGSVDAIIGSWARFFSKDVRAASWGHLARMEPDPLTLAHNGKTFHSAPGRAPAWMDYPGHVHGAIEDVPTKYAAYELAVRKQARFREAMEARGREIVEQGGNLADPLLQLNAEARAFEYAQRQVFMQENPLVKGFRRLTARAEGDSAAMKVGKGFAETLLPIVGVPTNWVGERLVYLTGLPSGTLRLIAAIRRGVDSVPFEEGDAIARQLKKGSFGLGLAWLGTAAADHLGGYWLGQRPGPGEPHEGEIRLFGVPIPKRLADHPALAQLQFFATVEKARRKHAGVEGVTRGALAGVRGTLEQVPFLELPTEVMEATQSPKAGRKFAGQYARGMTLPPDVQRAAKILDQQGRHEELEMLLQQFGLKHFQARKRHPRSLVEEYKTGVPGLRKEVP
jgi:hypothetical protein